MRTRPVSFRLAPGATENLWFGRGARDGLSTRAHPTNDARRIPYDDRVRRDVVDDDRTGADHGASPDVNRGDKHRAGSDRGAVVDNRAIPVGPPRVRGARTAHVGEDRGRTHEDIGAQGDAIPDARVALDPRTRADGGAARDEAESPDDDIRGETRAVGDDAGRVDRGGGAGADSLAHRGVVCSADARRDSW